uniref:Uncharacterized protein n=1 Tax=Panagrolaimus superbus TaxID=310955 RepID=A0A914XVG6_9BILA
MDAFGNPRALASDVIQSLQGLVFESDVPGFVYRLGFGVSQSLSKVASSLSHCIGSLTFDQQHELMRRRLMQTPPQSCSNNGSNGSAMSHFCNGIKGFGLGIFGGFTAIGDNIAETAKKDGIFAGITKGFVTGMMDTVTRPTQGVFDLLAGSASAVKEVVGNHSTKKSRFPERRLRVPRIRFQGMEALIQKIGKHRKMPLVHVDWQQHIKNQKLEDNLLKYDKNKKNKNMDNANSVQKDAQAEYSLSKRN